MRVECLQLGMSFFLLGQFILGICEAIYLDHYSQYKSQCYRVWEWLVAGCVIDICIPLLTRCGLTINRQTGNEIEDKENVTKIKTRVNIFQIGQLVVSIWAAVVWFNIDKHCYDYWNTNTKELWIFVEVHFVILWFIVANVLLDIFFGDKCSLNFYLSW
jgi:hypothetical protein